MHACQLKVNFLHDYITGISEIDIIDCIHFKQKTIFSKKKKYVYINNNT